MSEPAIRQSPIKHLLPQDGTVEHSVGGVSFIVRIHSENFERRAMQSLAICDLSGLRTLGVKGPDAESWLASSGIDVPAAIFRSRPLPEGGMIVRFAKDEFFLEDSVGNSAVTAIAARLASATGQVYRVEHQEATFLLVGSRSLEVLAQTCGINFRDAAVRHVIFTRVAGVSCSILPETVGEVPAYRFRVDPGYAEYLWERLVEICESLDGSVIGAGCVFPELLQ